MFEGFSRHRITVEGAQINCVKGGSGPPLLLLHGFPQSHAMWATIASRLAQHFTVVASDLRGYCDSSKPKCLPDKSNYAFRAFAADQVEVMRHFGFERFHVVGHDRGGRTGHRMALDQPDRVLSLAVLDIVPTYAMFMETNRHVAGAYWHWYFLAQPEPFPEHMIGLDPDFFYETCLIGWGAAKLKDFDAGQIAEYRRHWRDPAAIHGSCSDYRAAATIDLEHDAADIAVKVQCPTLAFWGTGGLMHKLFDMEAEWSKRCVSLDTATLPGGHFFPDILPEETGETLLGFLQHLA
jgi:haloacetate dehalogenase